ncbi:MAG: GGDEF domain-containing protein [Candidatus Omnitrophota bacterium]|nr:GGDEF domain-containing protein [Candidatus Omnitrophota bacterium]
MSTSGRIRGLVHAIRLQEEKAKNVYSGLLGRLSDDTLRRDVARFRDEEASHVRITDELLGVLDKYEARGQSFGARHGGFLWKIYVIIGIVLGMGAPIGCILIRYLWQQPEDLSLWWNHEFSQNRWFYVYMTVGTVFTFSLSGWVVGFVHDRLSAQAKKLTLQTRVFEERSEKDSRTGLYNFAAVKDRLMSEIERAKRFGSPLTCLMIDIDNLKEVNDTHGHPAGDEVIYYVSQVLENEIRVIDTAARYGGDEFFVILPVTPSDGARTVAERIRAKAADGVAVHGGTLIKTSVSIGVAGYPSSRVWDVHSLIEEADRVMYEAKHQGRNKVVLPEEIKDES